MFVLPRREQIASKKKKAEKNTPPTITGPSPNRKRMWRRPFFSSHYMEKRAKAKAVREPGLWRHCVNRASVPALTSSTARKTATVRTADTRLRGAIKTQLGERSTAIRPNPERQKFQEMMQPAQSQGQEVAHWRVFLVQFS